MWVAHLVSCHNLSTLPLLWEVAQPCPHETHVRSGSRPDTRWKQARLLWWPACVSRTRLSPVTQTPGQQSPNTEALITTRLLHNTAEETIHQQETGRQLSEHQPPRERCPLSHSGHHPSPSSRWEAWGLPLVLP